MAGPYLPSKSERDIDERKLQEERQSSKNIPRRETEFDIAKDGWRRDLSVQMAEVASKTKLLHGAFFEGTPSHALCYGLSYIGGGAVPLCRICFCRSGQPLFSIVITFIGLFFVGVFTTKFSSFLVEGGSEMDPGRYRGGGWLWSRGVENFWLPIIL